MLVLSRKPGESVVIGDAIRVTVVHAGSGRVRLGIEAPRDLPVHRDEIRRRIEQGVPWVPADAGKNR
jgi:carbon storage regulator